MNCKLLLALCAIICFMGSLEAASLRGADSKKSQAVVHKLDYEGVEANVRGARQVYPQDSGEDSDEDDEEEDAELQHQNAIRRQQAYEQSVDDSQEGSDEDDDDTEDDDADFYGRRLRRDVSAVESPNEQQENSKPSETSEDKEKQPSESTASAATPASSPSGSSNTSVLILIRDAIKKVTDLPNTQQVATSAQQYFQLFEHFLQQTIEQVIGDDDDDDEPESTTVLPEGDKESESETNEKVTETPDKESNDKTVETAAENEVPKVEKKPEESNEIKA